MPPRTPLEDIEHRFAYHPPSTDSVRRLHESIREHTHRLAVGFQTNLPDGREKSLALTKLEEAMFWANAAVARISNYEQPVEKRPVKDNPQA